MLACALYLVYFTMTFAAGTRVSCASTIFEDDFKTIPNNNYVGICIEFSKFFFGGVEAEEARLTMCYGDAIEVFDGHSCAI